MLDVRRGTFDRNARNVLPTCDLCNVSAVESILYSLLSNDNGENSSHVGTGAGQILTRDT